VLTISEGNILKKDKQHWSGDSFEFVIFKIVFILAFINFNVFCYKDVRILTSFVVLKYYNKSHWSKILSTNQVHQDSPPGQTGWHRKGERNDPISVTL